MKLSREAGPTLGSIANRYAGSNPYSPVQINYLKPCDSNATAIPDIRQADLIVVTPFCGHEVRIRANARSPHRF